MIDHVSIGVRDVAAAKRFYDAVLRPIGYRCRIEAADTIGYGDASTAFWIIATERPVPEDPKSGLHICFRAPTPQSVDAFHAAGLEAGARDNGKPGPRPEYAEGYYAAFLIDPHGYRIEAYYDGAG